jgi:hypothetical protein
MFLCAWNEALAWDRLVFQGIVTSGWLPPPASSLSVEETVLDETERRSMTRFNQLPLVAGFLVCASVAGLLLAADGWRRSPSHLGPRPFVPPEQWDCRDVVSHLHANGLDYRVVSTAERGPSDRNLYLTKTAKTWAELNGTPKTTESLDDWRGTVYCESMATPNRQEQIGLWGDCCLRLGKFVFFGDPAMLVEIGAALARSAPPAGIATATAN